MAIKFQYNKTSLGEPGKQLKMRQKAPPYDRKVGPALRSEEGEGLRKRLPSSARRSEGRVRLHGVALGEFDCDLLRIADVDLSVQKIAVCARPSCRK